MSLKLEIPELFKLEQLALHEEAKKLWNNLVLQNSKKISITLCAMDTPADLKLYKQNVLEALPAVLPPRFPKLLKDRLVDAMIDIRRGYSTAFDWIVWHYSLIKLSQETCGPINIITSCNNFIYSPTSPDIRKYEAIRFIKPLGHFDDLSWAKLFVTDENQSLKSRFYLACMYCFEDEIRSLWTTMMDNNQTLCEDDVLRINCTDRLIVEWWISFLKDRIYTSFYVGGWVWAFNHHHEHAAIFFWKHCSDDEKAEILSELDLSRVFDAVKNHRVGFVHFIYSLLFVESKNDLTSYEISIRKDYIASMMGLLLCSSYYQSILNDILAFRHCVPLEFYKYILELLASVISKSSITLHKEIFKIIWNRLSDPERVEIFSSSNILLRLTYISDIDLLEMIILPLPHLPKDAVLLKNFQTASPIYFFIRSDYEEFLCYLLILLLDYDAVSKKLTLRSNAAKLVDHFIKDALKLEYIFMSRAHILKGMMERFKETLPVIDALINRNECARFIHVLLSMEIYPLLAEKAKFEEETK